MTLTSYCPTCNEEVTVEVTLGQQAITSGPPERCDPGIPDEIEPETCSQGHPLDREAILVTAEKILQSELLEIYRAEGEL